MRIEKLLSRINCLTIQLVLILSFCCRGYSETMAIGPLMSKEKREAVVLIKYFDNVDKTYKSTATGLLFSSDWTYLVTAKHVLKNIYTDELLFENMKITFTAFIEGTNETVTEYFEVDLPKAIILESSKDVCAVKLGQFFGNRPINRAPGVKFIGSDPNLKRKVPVFQISGCTPFDVVQQTERVLFMGFPISLESSKTFDINQPLFREGIVSGKNKVNKTIIVDSAVYKGNSGSPVFRILETYSFENGKLIVAYELTFIGIAVKFIPYYSDSRFNLTIPRSLLRGYSLYMIGGYETGQQNGTQCISNSLSFCDSGKISQGYFWAR